MKLIMRYDGTYLFPASEDSADNYDKLKAGHEYTVEIKQSRNPQFHRLAFSLINAMFHNQERFESYEDFRRELKIMTGSYDEYITAKGQTVFIPASWSFGQMDDLEFHEIYNKLLSIAAKRYGDDFVEQFA